VCHKETELEDPKDLRAEIGKFPNSTNERKKMSKKTLRKRIAIVAVSALTAGVLSVMSAPVANAAALAANQIDIETTTATPGVCTVDTDKEIATISTAVSGVKVGFPAAADYEGYLSISGPGIFTAYTQEATGGSADTITWGPDQKSVTFNTDNASDDLSFTVKPTAVGKILITTRATSSTGTAVDVITMNVVASCANGLVDLAESYMTIVSSAEADENAAGWTSTKVDTADANTVAYSGTGFVAVRLNDVYGNDLPTSNGVLIVTATGDVTVAAEARTTSDDVLAPAAAGAAKTAYVTGTGADVVIRIDQDSGAPTSSTVSVTYNGTSIGSKTFTFLGQPAKVVVSDVTVGLKASSNGFGYFRYTITDAAGNPLSGKFAVADDVYNTDALAVVSTVTPRGSGAAGQTAAVTGKTPGLTGTLAENARYTCTNKGGAAKLQIKVAVDTNSTSYITSAPFDVFCGGAIDTWTISLDKATYAPGEIATLTVSAKDSGGRPVQTLETIAGLEYSFGGMTAVTAPTNGDYFNSAAGARTYKFSVGTSEGAFVGTFKITGATESTAKTVQYKVASSTATVSNADVLKSIVALIASINKQIQALQKLILKR